MAKRSITVEARFTAKDQASQPIARVESRFKRLTNTIKSSALAQVAALGGVVVALRALGRGISSSIKKANEQEVAVNALNAALSSLGDGADRVSKSLQAQAASLQQLTTFGDEQIIKVQTIIASFVKEEGAIRAATAATLDFATTFGLDLTAAAQLVAKTLGSTTNALTRYGIEVEGAVGSSERLESAIANIAKVAGGRAAADTKTFAGAVKQLGNVIGDQQEGLASFVTQNEGVIGTINDATQAIPDFVLGLNTLAAGIRNVADAQDGLIGEILGGTSQKIGAFLDVTIGGYGKLSAAITAGGEVTRLMDEATADLARNTQKLRDRLFGVADAQGNVTITAEEAAAALKRFEGGAEALVQVLSKAATVLDDDLSKAQKTYTQEVEDSLDVLREFGIVLSGDVNDQIAKYELALVRSREALDAGIITNEEYRRGAERIGLEVDALRSGFSSLSDQQRETTRELDSGTSAFGRQAGAIRGLVADTEALTRTQAQQRRTNLSSRRGLLNNPDPRLANNPLFPGLSGTRGTFTVVRRVTASPNGQVVTG